jgi:hypothetical protein
MLTARVLPLMVLPTLLHPQRIPSHPTGAADQLARESVPVQVIKVRILDEPICGGDNTADDSIPLKILLDSRAIA